MHLNALASGASETSPLYGDAALSKISAGILQNAKIIIRK
jgi:hypothetical protein